MTRRRIIVAQPVLNAAVAETASSGDVTQIAELWAKVKAGGNEDETRKVSALLVKNPNCSGALLDELARTRPEEETPGGDLIFHRDIIIHANCTQETYRWYQQTSGELGALVAEKGHPEGDVLEMIRRHHSWRVAYAANDAAERSDLWAAYKEQNWSKVRARIAQHKNADTELLELIFEDAVAELREQRRRTRKAPYLLNLANRQTIKHCAQHPNRPAGMNIRHRFWENAGLDAVLDAITDRRGADSWDEEQLRLADDLCQGGWKGSLTELAAAVGADLPN